MRAFCLLYCLLVCIAFSPSSWADDDDDKPSPKNATLSGLPTLAPAGTFVLDAATGKPAVGSLPVDLVRSPDTTGPDGAGRYLVVVNSGYGIQFDGLTNRGQQSIAVVDLAAKPAPAVVQNEYFPTPQCASVGAVFSPPAADGTSTLYVSGGFENKVWRFHFTPGDKSPISPGSPGPKTKVDAPFIDLAPMAGTPATIHYNAGKPAVYPLGLALAGGFLFSANNLDDSLGIARIQDGAPPALDRVDLRRKPDDNIYPYAVAARLSARTDAPAAVSVYVSLWAASAVAMVDWPPRTPAQPPVIIPTGSHPSALLMDEARRRLFVANSNDDSVSVISVDTNEEIERINVRLAESAKAGVSPEGLALDASGDTLYVANAASNAVAVVHLGDKSRVGNPASAKGSVPSRLAGLIPTGRYPSAVAVVGNTLFVGNGKGTGTKNSSNDVTLTGTNPSAPNEGFPARGKGVHQGRGGAYSVAVVSGNISAIPVPDDRALAAFTDQAMRQNGVIGTPGKPLFASRPAGSPIKHVVYVIKENRTYDQVFGDVKTSGDGTPADGDPDLAIFGSGAAARHPGGPAQDVTPNHRRLAERFGLLDRFFVNSEASADGHNWSTAAYSTDYVDKVFRWNYSSRGRSYDFEGFNRMPDTGQTGGEPLFGSDLTPGMMADFLRRYLPYTRGGRDAGEPATLYLWDLAARSGVTYRNYGEFVATASADDLAASRAHRAKAYPDTSPNVVAVPAKASLDGHYNQASRNFDLSTPDALTVDSYRAALESAGAPESAARSLDPMISDANADARFRGCSRMGAFLDAFGQARADLAAGKGDHFPALNILRLSNDHTSGMAPGKPSPQFDVSDNDYALGRLVEAVSHSPYWKDTAIVAVEDDAQDGPDHVDCHRSVALVISAYNRPGALIHSLHTTAGLVRTIEEMLGMPPMNSQDAAAAPVDVFRLGPPDLTPYVAALPQLDPNALITPKPESAPDPETAAAIRRSATLDLVHADASDPAVLNDAIWFSVRGSGSASPRPAHLPAYDLLRAGSPVSVAQTDDDDDDDD
jgi:YVTN family beta-propeller protein